MNTCSAPLDILITGGTLLTMSPAMKVVEDPVLGIRDGKILFVEDAHSPLAALYAPRERIDARGCIILPGLVNTHTHAPMVCFRGIADDLPLMRWLNDYIFPLERRYVTRPFVRAGTLLAAAEMIRSGTTTFCDGYFYESTVAETAREAGLRIVAGMGIFDRDFRRDDAEQIAKHVEAARRYLERWLGASELVTPALFCHAPYTCSPGTLKAVREVADAHGVFLITHLSETRYEIGIIAEAFGRTPARHLEALGVLNERTIAVHCNWLDDEEIAILARHDVKVSHNVESNMKLATGMAPVVKMKRQGVTVGLGTDGCASNNDHDLIGEMGTAARLHKILAMDPSEMDARTVLRMATIEGARALGLDGITGSLEKGKAADIIIVDTAKPRLRPLYNPYSQLVYAATGDDVKTVIIAGRTVMRDGRLLTIDEEGAIEAVERIADRIRSDNGISIPYLQEAERC